MYQPILAILIAGLLFVVSVVAPGSPGPTQAASGSGPGDTLFAAGDFAAAEFAYTATLRADPQSADAELGLARIALYRNDLDEAERRAKAMATDAPTDARANRLLESIAERRDDGPDYRAEIAGTEVDVAFTRTEPLPELEALVNGKRANLLIDTGGPGLDLDASFVATLGVKTEPAGEAVFAGGLRGRLRVGRVDRLDLGGASLHSIPIQVPPEMPPGVDGVIGTKVLYRFLSTIDYRTKRLVLRPKSESAAFEAEAGRRGAVTLPMLLVPDHAIFTTARVNDAPQALFNVDTGGPGIGVDLTKAELTAAAIVPDDAHPGAFLGGGGTTRTFPFVADVMLGRRTFRSVPGVYLPDGDRTLIFPFAVAGTLSQELFKGGALTFDFSAMKLVFEASPGP